MRGVRLGLGMSARVKVGVRNECEVRLGLGMSARGKGGVRNGCEG